MWVISFRSKKSWTMRCIDLYIEEIISWYFIFVPVQYKWLWILCRDATGHVRRRDSQLMRQKRKVRVNMYCENAQNGSYYRSVCSLTGLVLCTCTHCGPVLLARNVWVKKCLPSVRTNWFGRPLNKGKGFSKISKPTERNSAYHLQLDFVFGWWETGNWKV